MSISVIVILAILALSALFGYKKGLIKTAYSLFAFIIALVLTIALSPMVTGMIKGNDKIYNHIREKVAESVELSFKGTHEDSDVTITTDIDKIALPKSIKESIKETKETTTEAVKKQVTDNLTELIIKAVAFVGVFVAVSLALFIIAGVLNLISKLPGLNAINKWGGLAVGLARGLLVVWIFFMIVTAFAATEWGGKIFAEINADPITSYIYNHNYLMKFIK